MRSIDMTYSRRARLARTATTLAMSCGAAALTHAGGQPAEGYPNPYRVVENPLTPPDGRSFGWIFGLDVDRNGKDIWVLDTCGGDLQGCTKSNADPIMRFDASGTFVKSFGGGMLIHPHGLYVDPSGNIWVNDGVGGTEAQPAKGQQVFKFSPDGKLLLTLGTSGVKGNTETRSTCRPTSSWRPVATCLSPMAALRMTRTPGS